MMVVYSPNCDDLIRCRLAAEITADEPASTSHDRHFDLGPYPNAPTVISRLFTFRSSWRFILSFSLYRIHQILSHSGPYPTDNSLITVFARLYILEVSGKPSIQALLCLDWHAASCKIRFSSSIVHSYFIHHSPALCRSRLRSAANGKVGATIVL